MTDPGPTGAEPTDAAPTPRLVPLPGSARPNAADQHPTNTVPPETPVEITVVLRRRGERPADVAPMPADDYAAAYGADPADVDAATQSLTRHGLRVIAADAASRRIRVGGTAAAMGRVFGTTLGAVNGGTPGRRRSGGLSIPAELEGIVTAVLGLDDRPQTRARFQIAPAAMTTASYTPVELGTVYKFPTNTDGTGQSIAILELGGGYTQADLDTYFTGLGLAAPTVTAVGVDGAGNTPENDPNGPDGEVLLDIEVAGALAPKAAIAVYFAPNTDAGFLDALSQAAHASPTPAAISISWGQSEDAWTGQARTAFDDALADAAGLGATVTAAAGDDGSTDRGTDAQPHADFPASSPHALGCGGTTLDASGATITS
ncbi:MAG: S53 family peptidase [Mycobacteriales bacterium]